MYMKDIHLAHQQINFTNSTMKRILLLTKIIFTASLIIAQTTTLSFKLIRQVTRGVVKDIPHEYLFLTINNKVCYDSDRNGYTVGNGTLKLKNKGEQYWVYEGESFYGQCVYRIRNDYSKLNVEDVGSGTIYIYESCIIPSSVSTCTRVKSTQELQNAIVLPIANEPQNFTAFPSESRQKKMCSACKGTGLTREFVGVSIYSVDITYKCNVCNEIMHTYDKHIHQTCSACHGTGIIEL